MTHGPLPSRDQGQEASPYALEALVSWAAGALVLVVGNRKRLLICLLLGVGGGTAVAIAIPNQFTSSAAFIAQGSGSLNLPVALQGAAASLGLERGSDYSPKFYADLLTSRTILQSAILHQYRVPAGDSVRFETYLQIAGLSDLPPALALERAIKHLARRVAASADVRTNMITVSVRARYPELSRDLTVQLLSALDSLNVGFRQSQSRESRQFYETRVLQSRRELDSAEAAVQRFLQRNRVIASPALQFELQRLQRESDRKGLVYGTIVQQYEQARLQEARNVPTLTILADPFVPVKKSYPPRRFIVVLGALLSLMVLWTQRTISETLRRFREEEPQHWETLAQQLPGVRRLMGRP